MHIRSMILCAAMLVIACPAMGENYYVDSRSGTDAAGGGQGEAWKTLKRLDSFNFAAGDTVFFERGSSFSGAFKVTASGTPGNPVVFTASGEGDPPAFTNPGMELLNGDVFYVTGSHIVIENLYFHEGPEATGVDDGARKLAAVFITDASRYVTVRNCEFFDYPVGIQSYGQHGLYTHNIIRDCNRFLEAPGWGPVGIMLANSHHEIAYNRFSNLIHVGGTFGADGGAIELDNSDYDKNFVNIHHNISIGNEGFAEFSTRGANSFATIRYNISDDFQNFLFFWRADSCLVENNTIIRTREPNSVTDVVFTFGAEDAGINTIRNNIIIVAGGKQAFSSNGTEIWYGEENYAKQIREHNLYFSIDGSRNSDPIGLPPGPGEIIADPLFIDFTAGDYHLESLSPAINAGMAGQNQARDFDGNVVPYGIAPDIGAYEWVGVEETAND